MKNASIAIILVLFIVSTANAQPYRERILTPEDFGNIDRLEQPQPEQPKHQQNKPKQQKQTTYPNFGMNNWGGQPFKAFGPGHPWGRIDQGQQVRSFMGFGNQDTYEQAVKKERYPIIVIVTTEENGDLTVTSIVVKNPLRSKSLEAIIRAAK
jgi:hypothetical protein